MFKLSENANLNYVATICKITDVFPIENSDNLVRTVVNGFDIVVDKNTNVGDIVIYFPTESAICKEFLSINNLYDSFELNSNYAEVAIAIDEAAHIADETEYKERMKEIRRMAGFFNKHGRVRAINLRGCPSLGFLAKPEQFVNLFPKADFDWENNVGVSFDTIEDTLIVKKYVPRIVERQHGAGKSNAGKNRRAVQRFDRLIEGQFEFHYDTSMLNANMWRFNPDSMVSISKKIHGCVERNTIVNTLEYGDKTIGEIVDNKIACSIRSFNTETKEIEYAPIEQFYCVPEDGEWYEIELEDGTTITITGNNPVWVPELNCYRRVDELTGDEKFLVF